MRNYNSYAGTWEDYDYGSPDLDEVAEQLMRQFGIRTQGSNFDFNGYIEGQFPTGLWIAADSYPEFFNYWADGGQARIDPDLERFAKANDMYWDWYDSGTMMLWFD